MIRTAAPPDDTPREYLEQRTGTGADLLEDAERIDLASGSA
jgi:hypothetical protein